MRNRILERLLAAGLVLTAVASAAVAETYHDVEYRGGYPGMKKRAAGTLQLDEGGLAFQSEKGQAFRIPLADIRSQAYSAATPTRPSRVTVVDRQGNMLATPEAQRVDQNWETSLSGQDAAGRHDYTVQFEDAAHATHEVTFRLPNADTQRALFNALNESGRRSHYEVMTLSDPAAPSVPAAPTAPAASAPTVPAAPADAPAWQAAPQP